MSSFKDHGLKFDYQKQVNLIAKLKQPPPERMTFHAIKGKQSKFEIFTIMMPFSVLAKLFTADDEDNVDLRSQRLVSNNRAGKITKYLHTSDSYVLPSLTATIKDYIPDVEMIMHNEDDFKTSYYSTHDSGGHGEFIALEIPETSKLFFIDGQHRATGIQGLARAVASTGMTIEDMYPDDTVPVMLRIDTGLMDRQSQFATINSTMVKPNASLNHLYNKNSRCGIHINAAIKKSISVNKIEFDKAGCSGKNPHLFSYRHLVEASLTMLDCKIDYEISESEAEPLYKMWEVYMDNPAWDQYRILPASKSRDDLVLCHAVFLQSYAKAIKALREANISSYKAARKLYQKIDYSRDAKCWQGLFIFDGKLVKNSKTITATSNFILERIGHKELIHAEI